MSVKHFVPPCPFPLFPTHKMADAWETGLMCEAAESEVLRSPNRSNVLAHPISIRVLELVKLGSFLDLEKDLF